MNDQTQDAFDTQKKNLRQWIERRSDSVLLHAIVHDLMEENALLKEKLSIRGQE